MLRYMNRNKKQVIACSNVIENVDEEQKMSTAPDEFITMSRLMGSLSIADDVSEAMVDDKSSIDTGSSDLNKIKGLAKN